MKHEKRTLTDEERRDFLKVLGVTGAVAAGSATLDEVRRELRAEGTAASEKGTTAEEAGEAIATDVSKALDGELLAAGQQSLSAAAGSVAAALEAGVPVEATEPRDDFSPVAQTGYPVYEHLLDAGFFESATRHLPAFTPEYVESSVRRFVTGETLAQPLAALGFSEREMVDLLATAVNHRERLGDRHWLSADVLGRENVEVVAEHVPPMTQAAMGGVLLWAADLDEHLWHNALLISDEILADAVWHTRTMAAGFALVVEGAGRIATDPNAGGDGAIAALLASGFALQTIGQSLLPQDVYWITDEMRADRDPNRLAFPEVTDA